MTIPIKAVSQWEKAENALLQAARDVNLPCIDKAGKIMKAQALHQNLEEPSIEPRVQIQITEPDKYNRVLRDTMPTRKRARLEQDITRRYLQIMEREKGVWLRKLFRFCHQALQRFGRKSQVTSGGHRRRHRYGRRKNAHSCLAKHHRQ